MQFSANCFDWGTCEGFALAIEDEIWAKDSQIIYLSWLYIF